MKQKFDALEGRIVNLERSLSEPNPAQVMVLFDFVLYYFCDFVEFLIVLC